MTRLAFGAKWSARRTPGAPAMAGGAARSRGFKSEASAAVPMPAALRPKKCLRVMRSPCSWFRSMRLAFGYGFIEVEDRARHHGPGGQLGRVQLLVPRRLADREQLQ